MNKRLAFVLSFTAAVGCGSPDAADDDAIDDVAVEPDGKGDAFGYVEGTPQAKGILRVANEATLADLKSKVGITSQSAKAIVAGRTYTTLTQLDSVAYVGKTTFKKLLAYATNLGYVTSGPVPQPTFSLWDDLLATGTAITLDHAKARFAPGATSANGGPFVVQQRTRSCNATTGCRDWTYPAATSLAYSTFEWWNPGPGWSNQRACFQFGEASYATVGGSVGFVLGMNGRIDAQLTSTQLGTVTCSDVTTGSTSCGSMSGAALSNLQRGTSCSLPNPAGPGVDDTIYPTSVAMFNVSDTAGAPLAFSLRVTDRYAYARSHSEGKADAQGTKKIVEYALYASLDGSPLPTSGGGTCKPTSCAQQGKSCGNIPDGCGGTLSCGACGYPRNCGTDNTCQLPPSCNLQPCGSAATVGSTCCSPGQTTCGGHAGCTCYDACS